MWNKFQWCPFHLYSMNSASNPYVRTQCEISFNEIHSISCLQYFLISLVLINICSSTASKVLEVLCWPFRARMPGQECTWAYIMGKTPSVKCVVWSQCWNVVMIYYTSKIENNLKFLQQSNILVFTELHPTTINCVIFIDLFKLWIVIKLRIVKPFLEKIWPSWCYFIRLTGTEEGWESSIGHLLIFKMRRNRRGS